MKSMKNNHFGMLAAVGSVGVIVAAVALAQQQITVPGSNPGVEHAEALSMTFRGVAKAVLPAVVSIETRSKAVNINQQIGRAHV